MNERLAQAPRSRGKAQLLRHLSGERLTLGQAVAAKCCDCMGYHVDGRVDCRMSGCPLYPWMPYRLKIVSEGVDGPVSGGTATQPSADGSGQGDHDAG